MPYLVRREIIGKDYKMGFDYLPQNYEKLSHHSQMNKYTCALWYNESEHLQEVMFFCEFGDLQRK